MFKAMDNKVDHALNSDEGMAGSGARLYRAQLIVENRLYDQLLNRYQIAMARLKEVTREANALHEENEWLQLGNEELTRRLLGSATEESGDDQNKNTVFGSSLVEMSNEAMGGISTSSTSSSRATSVIMDESVDSERSSLPKSISIPSPGYFKLLNQSPSSLPRSPQAQPPPPIRPHRGNGTRLRVRGEEKAVEIEVFNQGMHKTELCNKWQETGSCPYADHCRFAHGLQELRPVIRHPRYKTQVCRMVLAGTTCPYGHRCHFRHSLPPSATTTRRSSLS